MLVLACLLPGVLGAGLLMRRLYEEDRHQTAETEVWCQAREAGFDAELVKPITLQPFTTP